MITELRAAFGGPCQTVQVGGDPDDTSRFAIVSGSGDRSLVPREVRTNGDGTRTDYRIALRRGDVFTEVRTRVDGFTEAQASDLAQRAAQRLCAAAPGC